MTNKKIATRGIHSTVDEVCFPIKIYFCHVEQLLEKVDYIFCPRIVGIEPKAYICPKFMGLPDMVKGTFKENIKIIAPTIKIEKDQIFEHKKIFLNVAGELGSNYTTALNAWKAAKEKQDKYNNLLQKEINPLDALKIVLEEKKYENDLTKPKIAVMGHGYNLYDSYLNMNLIEKVTKQGFKVVTPDMVADHVINHYNSKLRKKVFWSLGKKIVGSLINFIENKEIQGIIYIASFGCGPDSLIGHIAENHIRKNKIPFMLLTIDEHTGEAGINTRLEAFLDMLKRRKAV